MSRSTHSTLESPVECGIISDTFLKLLIIPQVFIGLLEISFETVGIFSDGNHDRIHRGTVDSSLEVEWPLAQVRNHGPARTLEPCSDIREQRIVRVFVR